MTTTAFDLASLGQFTGTDNLYRHPLCRALTYTDGVKHLAEGAGAYWLIDLIASHQIDPRISVEPFQCWRLRVADGAGHVECSDGNENELGHQAVPMTDFPAPGVTLYLVDGVLMLPGEY